MKNHAGSATWPVVLLVFLSVPFAGEKTLSFLTRLAFPIISIICYLVWTHVAQAHTESIDRQVKIYDEQIASKLFEY